MSKSLKKQVALEDCPHCGKQVAKTGLANHIKHCKENPENAGVDVDTLEDTEEVDTSFEDSEEEMDEADAKDADTGADEEEEIEEDDTTVYTSDSSKVIAVGLSNHKFFHFTDYIHIKRGETIELDKEIFKVLAQQGHVVLK